MTLNKRTGLRARLFGATLIAVTALSAGLALAAGKVDVPQQFPIADFFSNPEKAYFRLSEDGKTLGFMQPVAVDGNPRRLNVFVQALDGSKPVGEARRLTGETARDIGIYYWKGSDTVLYAKDFGGDENTHVVAVDVETGKITDLTPGDKVRAGIQDDLPDDPGHILVIHNRRNAEVFDVYRINLKTGKGTLVAENPGDIIRWQTDHAGRLRMAVRTDGLNTITLYRDDEKSEFKPIVTTDYKTDVVPAFFTADNDKFYAISNRGRDKKALVLIDPAKPDVEEVLYVHPEVDLDGATWSRARQKLTRADYVTAKSGRKFFDTETEAVFERLERELPGMEINLQANDKAENKFIVAASNDRTLGARYIYDAKADTLSKLADLNPKLPEAAMAPVKPIQYQSRDGLTINGYLTLPLGVEPKNLACIVNPHGGPWARDVWGYNPEVQFLANRGYCILQLNFRGSTGYGREFWEASFGQWGLKMQDDITDGSKWLIAQGIADPKRLGIYGGSYGGYATLAGVVYTPDLYAAAVDYVGVSNLLTFMNTIPPYWKPILPKFQAMIGDPAKDLERMKATSPALHADRIKTPLFIAQGANDPRVNKAESDQMVEALKKRGVEVQYMVKDNEGHGFRNEENQYEFYGAMEAFLAKHLQPRATVDSAAE
ncbi:MAG: S9 family peptidase [Chloroflexota bacterium]|nr:S9 family peptidase [Chloroflexota bacterium]